MAARIDICLYVKGTLPADSFLPDISKKSIFREKFSHALLYNFSCEAFSSTGPFLFSFKVYVTHCIW